MASKKKNMWDLQHAEAFHNANRKFFGVPGKVIETDMGPELTWEEKPDRELGIYLMLCDIHDMLMDLHDKMEK